MGFPGFNMLGQAHIRAQPILGGWEYRNALWKGYTDINLHVFNGISIKRTREYEDFCRLVSHARTRVSRNIHSSAIHGVFRWVSIKKRNISSVSYIVIHSYTLIRYIFIIVCTYIYIYIYVWLCMCVCMTYIHSTSKKKN